MMINLLVFRSKTLCCFFSLTSSASFCSQARSDLPEPNSSAPGSPPLSQKSTFLSPNSPPTAQSTLASELDPLTRSSGDGEPQTISRNLLRRPAPVERRVAKNGGDVLVRREVLKSKKRREKEKQRSARWSNEEGEWESKKNERKGI